MSLVALLPICLESLSIVLNLLLGGLGVRIGDNGVEKGDFGPYTGDFGLFTFGTVLDCKPDFLLRSDMIVWSTELLWFPFKVGEWGGDRTGEDGTSLTVPERVVLALSLEGCPISGAVSAAAGLGTIFSGDWLRLEHIDAASDDAKKLKSWKRNQFQTIKGMIGQVLL